MSPSIGSLAGKVIFITGASRGIGRSIALRAAADGAKIILAAKTIEPNSKLPGTIIDAAEEVTKAGGQALPCQLDVRYEDQVNDAINKAAKHFGGIDMLINNASAISLTDVLTTPMNSYDLMMDINVRGSFMCSKAAIPHLKKREQFAYLISFPTYVDGTKVALKPFALHDFQVCYVNECNWNVFKIA